MTSHNTQHFHYKKNLDDRAERQQRVPGPLCSVDAELLADLRQSALALAFRNLELTPGDRDAATAYLGICQECHRGSASWTEIPHTPSCETGRVLLLAETVRLVMLRAAAAPPRAKPPMETEFVETYSVEIDKGQSSDVRA